MSLGIAFKGTEGIVLAADSRVTLSIIQQQPNGVPTLISSTFDNATKLLKVKGQNFVGAVTYGVGAIGQQAPRTAHSFIPEFEAELAAKHDGKRLGVEEFAKELSAFFATQWKAHMNHLQPQPGNEMVFLVGGYDENSPYGRVFEFAVPLSATPVERYDKTGHFGAVWGGQREFVDRILNGFDQRTIDIATATLNLDPGQRDKLRNALGQLVTPIPPQFLPLQDCVDLCIYLIRSTMTIQSWTVGVRGVGGAIDVAAITKTDGFKAIQQKQVAGERPLFINSVAS